MGFKNDFFVDLVGAVTIVTDELLVFQGQIIREHERGHHEEEFPKEIIARLDMDPEFIAVKLICDPAIITDDGNIEEIEPDLFKEGDVVRINVNEIVSVGPSRCCLAGSNEKG